MSKYTGSCLCGGIKFSINGEFAPIQICYCMQCRKAQGTALVTNVPVNSDVFQLEQGSELMSFYESSPGKQRVFCKVCGSPIFSKRDSLPDVLRIRIGLINEEIDSQLLAHFHTESKANWWPICDQLPQFKAGL